MIRLIILFISSIIVLNASITWSEISSSERKALIDLYQQTNGTKWTYSNNWNGAIGTECTWYGISCDPDNSHIQSIDLHLNKLEGRLPETIKDISELSYLILYGNQLSGPLPSFITSLTQLKKLDLRGNSFYGMIPTQITQLTHLSYLDLSGNQLEGAIPSDIHLIKDLTHLDLSDNQLNQSIPVAICNLSDLQHLALHQNQLSGDIPNQIGQLTQLSYLSLHTNTLSGGIPEEIGQLSQLAFLYLHENNLTGTIPKTIGQLSHLHTLQLNHNQLTGSIPDTIGNNIALNQIFLHHNALSGAIPDTICQLTALSKLFLGANQFTGPIPEGFNQLTQIFQNYIDLRWNGLYNSNNAIASFLASRQPDWESTQTVAPQTIQAQLINDNEIELTWEPIAFQGYSGGYDIEIATKPSGPFRTYEILTDKFASKTNVTELTPSLSYYFRIRSFTNPHPYNTNQVYSDYSDIVSLIRHSDFPETERQVLIDLYQSTNGNDWVNHSGWLDVSGTECSWYGIYCNEDNTHVSEIKLPSNNLTGKIPNSINQLPYLTVFNLFKNNLTGQLPSEIGTLIGLTYLDLSSNHLTGSLPQELGYLTNLQNLMVYSNDFSGELPDSFSRISNLKRLLFHHNHFTGSIPDSITSLIQLEKITLSSNAFTGKIPQGFTRLTSLQSGTSDFRWNGFSDDDYTLLTFINHKQSGVENYQATQTIPPTNITVMDVSDTDLQISWQPILYSGDLGGYEIHSASDINGPYSLVFTTIDKHEDEVILSHLTTGKTYYIKIRSVTYSHENNRNTVYSAFSIPVSSTLRPRTLHVSEISDQIGFQNAELRIPFHISDDNIPISQLTILTESSNITLIASNQIFIEGSSNDRFLVLLPSKDQLGLVKITLTVSNGYQSVIRSFRIRIESLASRPNDPTGLSVENLSARVTLSWDPIDAPYRVIYHVYRSLDEHSLFTQISTYPIDNLHLMSGDFFTDSDVEVGQTYYYKIKAFNGDIESENFSNVVQATPTGFIFQKGDLDGNGKVNLIDGMMALILSCTSNNEGLYFFKQAEVNEDAKIGLEEVIYIIQYISSD